MEQIRDYLMERYHPETVILYGSFADGTNGPGSDYDALLLAEGAQKDHDVSVVNGTQLDVFVYPPEAELPPEELLQLYHARVLLDRNGRGASLLARVRDYVDAYPRKTGEELEDDLAWCKKMLLRTDRGDTEGFYRWHWVLCDSLEIYCGLRQWFYFGPKKALYAMEREDPEAFCLYGAALAHMDRGNLARWITYLTDLAKKADTCGQSKG